MSRAPNGGRLRGAPRPASPVVLVTSGPGATNTVTGLLTAQMDSAPIIVICGQTNAVNLGKDAFQEADVTEHLPGGEHSYSIKNPADILRVARGVPHATTGRPGPVLIDAERHRTARAPRRSPTCLTPGYTVPGRGDEEQIARAARYLRESRRLCSTSARAP